MDIYFRPLQGWPKEPMSDRRGSMFRIEYEQLVDDLEEELRFLQTDQAIISVAVTKQQIRLDGTLRAGVEPTQPGVVLNILRTTGNVQFACDTYTEWRSNLRAISLTLTALRSLNRYGCSMSTEQYQGFAQIEG